MIDSKRLEFLNECAELSNDIWGETVLGLLDAAHSCRHASREFLAALENEILGELEWAEENCRIVERKETRTQEVTYKELEVEL